jgi:hypothetical protein
VAEIITTSKRYHQSNEVNITKGSNKREGVVYYSTLFEIGKLSVSDTFVLTNCIMLHHWWIALSYKGQTHVLHWLHALD